MTTFSAVLPGRIVFSTLDCWNSSFCKCFQLLDKEIQSCTVCYTCFFNYTSWHGTQGLFRPWQPWSRSFALKHIVLGKSCHELTTRISRELINQFLLRHTAHLQLRGLIQSFSVTETDYMDRFVGTPWARLPIFKIRQDTSVTYHIPLAMTTKIKLKLCYGVFSDGQMLQLSAGTMETWET